MHSKNLEVKLLLAFVFRLLSGRIQLTACVSQAADDTLCTLSARPHECIVRLRGGGMELSASSSVRCWLPPPCSSSVWPSPTVSTSPPGFSFSLSATWSLPPLVDGSRVTPSEVRRVTGVPRASAPEREAPPEDRAKCDWEPLPKWWPLLLPLCELPLLLSLLLPPSAVLRDLDLLLSSTPSCCLWRFLRCVAPNGDCTRRASPFCLFGLPNAGTAGAAFCILIGEGSAQSVLCLSSASASDPPPADWFSVVLRRLLRLRPPSPVRPGAGADAGAFHTAGADTDADKAADLATAGLGTDTGTATAGGDPGAAIPAAAARASAKDIDLLRPGWQAKQVSSSRRCRCCSQDAHGLRYSGTSLRARPTVISWPLWLMLSSGMASTSP